MTNETHILNLHSQGLLNAEIARAVNVSQSLVYYYLHKHNLVRNEMDYV